ncbi:MAG: MATE family efflux transporter [Bullifex sp.]
MIERKDFRKELLSLAVPVTLQGIFNASFNVIDQLMTGQLGSSSIAAIGLSGKFIGIFNVLVNTFAAVAGIIIAQAIGRKNSEDESKGYYTSFIFTFFLALVFTSLSLFMPGKIMGLYSADSEMISIAESYLRIYSGSFIAVAVTTMMSTYLRCIDRAKEPLYAGVTSMAANTVLNYVLIFGFGPIPALGVKGAALASVIAQVISMVILIACFMRFSRGMNIRVKVYGTAREIRNFGIILLPLFISEFLWVMGENIYASIYGHLGTKACAAMTLLNPICSLVIGALTGVSAASGIIVGKYLGASDRERAYEAGGRLLGAGFAASLILSLAVAAVSPFYVKLFNVEEEVMITAVKIICVFALFAPVKVLNMILGSGILRSGGKTAYLMCIDIFGTWGVGVPLGLLSAFTFSLPIWWVYFILTTEECVRLVIGLAVFRTKRWMGTV